ncbi:MAG: hypothetical protein IJW32_00720 [Clostridia bacterium]|nr:hypothetical protein [Clostridia bacterium]
MEKKDYLMGSILLTNLILNTKALQSAQEMMSVPKDTTTTFSALTPQHIYPRIVSDIDFLRLSEADKSQYLFLAKEQEGKVDKYDLYTYEMQLFSQEAHNRTAAALGVKPTLVLPCEFSKSRGISDPTGWIIYDVVNGNMYVNAEKDYSIARPSYLLENINASTRQHSIFHNIFKALTDPSSLSDREYFLALSTAVKTYVYQDLKENAPEQYAIEIAADYATPAFIEQTLYGFSKTRSDFQAVGLYGGKLQEDLRRNETIYHEYLQSELTVNCMTNMEDIFAYFRQSPLNSQSSGMLYGILSSIERATAHSFFNSIGADMEEGQSLSEYIDELEVEMYDRYGIPLPTDDELDEFTGEISDTLAEEDEMLKRGIKPQGYGVPVFRNGSEFGDDEFVDEEDATQDEMPTYKPMDSVLPDEGKINNITELPFHNHIKPTQDTSFGDGAGQ